MKKYNSITVKELLDLEDGYYNLMSPIPYVIGDKSEASKTDGEIDGIVRIITDVAPSGVTKIITTMNDNLSCFVGNVLQDGDVLSVIATDKDAGEGGGDEGEKFKVYLAEDGSVDATKTGMSGVDVYNELIKHDGGDKKIKNCVIIFDNGTELTEGLVNTMQVHAGGQIEEQRVAGFPIDDDSWWQIGEDGYGSIQHKS